MKVSPFKSPGSYPIGLHAFIHATPVAKVQGKIRQGLPMGAHVSVVVHVLSPVQVALRLPVKPSAHHPLQDRPSEVELSQLVKVPWAGFWGVLAQTVFRVDEQVGL